MAATIDQIRSAIATKLAGITELNQASEYMLSNPSPPMMQVMGPDAVDYDQAMQRGLDNITIVVQAFAGTPDDAGAQALLDGWIDPSGSNSVKAVLEATDITLGGLVASCRVARCSGYRQYDLPNRGHTLGCEFFLDVKNQK